MPEPVDEDDEFEEFREETWTDSAAVGGLGPDEWAGDWDDEGAGIETDFTEVLKAELAAAAAAAAAADAAPASASSAMATN